MTEAEDAVQETWLRNENTPAHVKVPKAFLSAVVTRIALDVVKSARVQRVEYGKPWFLEPLLTDPYEDPDRSAELADSVSMAALLLMERLSPLERAVFVLRDGFGFDFAEIAFGSGAFGSGVQATGGTGAQTRGRGPAPIRGRQEGP